jgi:hypothetical protein
VVIHRGTVALSLNDPAALRQGGLRAAAADPARGPGRVKFNHDAGTAVQNGHGVESAAAHRPHRTPGRLASSFEAAPGPKKNGVWVPGAMLQLSRERADNPILQKVIMDSFVHIQEVNTLTSFIIMIIIKAG